MSLSVLAFLPKRGKLVEATIDEAREAYVNGPVRPVIVQREKTHGVTTCKVDLLALGGAYWARHVTGQARRVAEAAVWVSAVHAFALFGAMAGAAFPSRPPANW